MATFPGWVATAVAAAVPTIGAIFLAGSNSRAAAETSTRLEQVEKVQAADHDKLTTHDTTLGDIKSDVSEIKQDVKSLLQRPSK